MADKSQTFLRYIDEFVRLSSAPTMLELNLFPNSKEISESMAMWEAYRKFLAKHCADFTDEDAFIAVGDGATPRTAALFAFLGKGGTCFAIDPLLAEGAAKMAKKMARSKDAALLGAAAETVSPASEVRRQSDHNAEFFCKLESSSRVSGSDKSFAVSQGGELRSHPWDSIRRLKVLPHRIERVRIKVRRAVVILLHCHCSLPQVMASIQCEELVGLITSPCCQWIVSQQSLHTSPPIVCYKDPCMLSSMNDVRIWAADAQHVLSVAKALCDRKEILHPTNPVVSALFRFPDTASAAREGAHVQAMVKDASQKHDAERKVGSEEEDAGEGEGVVQQRRRRPQIDQAAHAVLHAAFAENPHRSGVCVRA